MLSWLVTALLLLHCFVSWLMTGVIWQVQLVHYPLFLRIGPAEFPAYEQAHKRRITYIVFPLMSLELVTALLLLLWPAAWPLALGWAILNAALVGLTWLLTAFVHMPQHTRLAHNGYDPGVLRRLVRTNWWRTLAWTFHSLLLLYVLFGLLAG
jgi:hypothetical protein